jgi:hypothetical protein
VFSDEYKCNVSFPKYLKLKSVPTNHLLIVIEDNADCSYQNVQPSFFN